MHVYLDVVTFRDTLTGLAHDQNCSRICISSHALRDNFLRDVTRAQQTLQLFPGCQPRSHDSGQAGDREGGIAVTSRQFVRAGESRGLAAVRFRLAGQEQALIALSSSLVADVDQEVAQEHARALESVQQTRRQFTWCFP